MLTASDGLSALDILKTYTPDVIFVDLVMPYINGEKFCRIIRGMPHLGNVYIIVLSALVSLQEMDYASFGANACIPKGSFKNIGKAVSAALEQKDYCSTSADSLTKHTLRQEKIYQGEITRELLSAERHLKAILSNMFDGLLEITPDARIIYANTTAISFIGVPEEKLLSANLPIFFDDSCRHRVENALRALEDVPLTLGANSPLTLNNKQILLNFIPVTGGEHQSVIVIIRDITAQLLLEEERMGRARFQSVVEMAGTVAHELNSPMFAVLGTAQLIREECGDDHPYADDMDVIIRNAKKMADLTKKMISMTGYEVKDYVGAEKLVDIDR